MRGVRTWTTMVCLASVFGACRGCASAPDAATPHVDSWRQLPAVYEEFQPPEGRDAGAANAWGPAKAWAADVGELEARTLGWSRNGQGEWGPRDESQEVEYDYLLKAEVGLPGDPARWAHAEKVVAAFEASDLPGRLGRIGAMPRMAAGEGGRPLNEEFASLKDWRLATKIEALRLSLAARAGRADAAIDAFEQGLTVARLTAQQPTLVMRLVANSEAQMMTAALAERFASMRLSAAQLARLAEVWAAYERRVPSWAFVMKTERLSTLDVIEKMYEQSSGRGVLTLEAFKGGASVFLPGDPEELFKKAAAHGAVKTERETIEEYEQMVALMTEMCDQTMSVRTERGLSARFEELAKANVLFEQWVPAMTRVFASADEARVRADAFRLNIAIERFRVTNARLPGALAELVPQFVAELPSDPFVKGPYRYRVLDAAAKEGGYVLYTVGIDSFDNGGNPDWPDGSYTLHVREEPKGGYDFVMGPMGAPKKK